MDTIFLTGFPGFLGARLLPLLLERHPDHRAVCLVQDRYGGVAARRLADLTAASPGLAGRVELVAGDITRADLGLDDPDGLASSVREIWHLAAVYDLAVAQDLAWRVNVEGTRHVLDFAGRCGGLRRHHYVSTCYVSGRHCGPFRETDLDVGQRFNNHYEATKFEAEHAVASARSAGMPTTVYRPAVVVGDSRTGETQKFDGPYFVLQWLLRQPRRFAVMPMLGDPTMARFNMVPSDFVVDAIAHLSGLEASAGRTYQLADPAPLTVEELATELCRATDRRGVRVRLPRRPTRWLLARSDALERFLGIPAEATDYFTHPTHYDTSQAAEDLAGSGITCPTVTTYLPALVAWMNRHPDAGVGAMA